MALFFNDSFIHSITYLFLYINFVTHRHKPNKVIIQETDSKKQLLNHLPDEVELIFFENTASSEMSAYKYGHYIHVLTSQLF